MTETTTYAPGTPLWVDLGSPDLEGSKAFYGALFDWEADAPNPEAGGYTLVRRNGKLVAGLGPLMNPNQPPAWTTYVATENADETAQKAREAGGQVLMEPMTVMEEGRMALFADPTGAVIGVWQPNRMTGAELVNQPGSFIWNELATRNIQAAKDFYARVFDWEGETSSFAGGEYTQWMLNGRSIGGAMEMTEQFPANVPPHWLTYFAVEDVDATAKKAEELGGSITVPPTDIEGMGRFAVIVDPQGAVFALFEAKQ
jgi:predicted enzyme related to lactoylglutathione lyase